MRYLLAAFFARPGWPLFRVIPWNAAAVVAAGIAGWFDPSIWLTAAVGEFIYLFTLSTHPAFQQWIDARTPQPMIEDTNDARQDLLAKVGGAARQRYVKLEEKRAKLEALPSDDLLHESNKHALRHLSWLFLRLLVAQRDMRVATKAEPKELEQQIEKLESELLDSTKTAQESKQATIALLRERLENVRQKETSLAEIEADLARIEAQLDVALEDATLRDAPVAISQTVELTSLSISRDQWTSGQVDESSSHRVAE
jgi:hypothetical protein